MNQEDLIKRIEHAKHDIKMRVRAVVLDPISAMNISGAHTTSYVQEQGPVHKDIISKAQFIMKEFSEKWRDTSCSEDDQILQMKTHIARVSQEYIPQIQSIALFYQDCINHKYYFSDSEDGQRALKLMIKSVSKVEKVCLDLSKLFSDSDKPEVAINKQQNLLSMLQEVLDDIQADVQYVNEVGVASFELSTDKDIFQNHVLLNIQENIDKHAFGTKDFKKKHIWERIVSVEIREKPDLFEIRISNNGCPFKGKPEKIFDYGYCHGEAKHSGIGLNSAKEHMRQLGGDILFQSTPKELFTVHFIISLPKVK